MKQVRYMILLLVLLLSATLFSQRKIALIVAIGDYPAGGRWKSLSSINDVKYVKAALIKNGFQEKDIDTLKNQAATKAGIVKALDDLYAKVSAGDIVYFHFSGHGQQIEDDNGDEEDGYDEALVAYDAKAAYDPVSYQGQNHLRDDLLGEKLSKIRTKIGSSGSLLVILDACHSGTATRGNEFTVCRGTPIPFQSPGYKPKTNINLAAAKEPGFFGSAKERAANMVVISASSPDQVNYETKDMDNAGVGALSYAFAKAISDLKEGSDYSMLFEKIKAQIQARTPAQIPMIEGETHQEIFSGHYLKKQERITIQQWGKNDSTFTINAGVLNNINTGSTIKIFTMDHEAVASGYVKEAGIFQSVCVANKDLKRGEAYEIKLDAVNYGDFAASIFIKTNDDKTGKSAALQKQLQSFIKPYPFLSLSSNADLMLDISGNNTAYNINLVEKGDSIHYSKIISSKDTLSNDDWNYFMEGIKRAVRIKYFRSISDGGALASDVQIKVAPKAAQVTGNEITLKPMDQFDIKVTNKGKESLYFTIIDLMPNNDIKVLIPDEEEQPQDYIITPGETKTIGSIQVDPGTPRGKEFFKAVFTKVPMDLRTLLNRKKVVRGPLQSFERVVDDMFKEGAGAKHTRGDVGSVKVDEVGIVTCGFTIAN